MAFTIIAAVLAGMTSAAQPWLLVRKAAEMSVSSSNALKSNNADLFRVLRRS